YDFHSISPATLPASLLTIPTMPLILPAVSAAAVLGLIWHPLGYLPGWIAWIGLKYLEATVTFFGNIPFGKIETGRFAEAIVCLYYACLLLLNWKLPGFLNRFKSGEISPEEKPAILQSAWVWSGAFMLTTSFFLWNEALRESDTRLHIKFLDTPGVNAM